MRKKMIACLFVVVFPLFCQAQDKLPNSIVNLGVGAGMNYGIFGTKTVVGYRNSGALIGLGYMPGGFLGYEIGAQVSIKWFYANIGYGTFGTIKVNNAPEETLKAGNILIGGMIGLGQEKRVFIDLGIGHTFGAPSVSLPFGTIDQNTVTFVLGLGFRLGTVAKTDNK